MLTLTARPHKALAAGLLLFVAAALCAAPAPARAAAPTHSQLFTYYASPEKECPPSPAPCNRRFPPPREGLEDACGVAVDSAGDVYVSDYYHDAVDVFSPSLESPLGYLTQVKAESNGNGPCALAVDGAGNVYVDNWRQNVVRYAPAEFPPGQSTPYGAGALIDSGIEGRGATGVTIDPATGDLYVDDRTYVAEYQAPIAPGDEPLARIGLGSLGKGYGVAVSDFGATKGDVYVADSSDDTVKVYNPAEHPASPVAVIDGAGTPQAGFSSLVDSSLAVDQTDGHVYVLDDLLEPFEHPEAVLDEFNPAGSYRGQIAAGSVDAEPSGLAVDPGGNVYLTSGNTELASVLGFGPVFPAHTLTVARTGAGTGTVKSEPAGIDCGTACAAEYNVGEAVTLTATSAAGSAFAGWTVNGNPATCPSAGACQLTLSADAEVSAEFTVAPATAPIAPATLPAIAPAASSPGPSVAPTSASTTASSPGRPLSRLRGKRHRRHHKGRDRQAKNRAR